jgi:ankyrin repeat protein
MNQTALMWAAAERQPEIVRELVTHGANVHARSKLLPEPEPYVIDVRGQSVFGSNYPATIRFPEVSGGFTALHFAAQQGVVESARVLLDAGADVNSSHPEHGSPLVIAIASGHEDMAKFLLERGADPNIKDAWGIAPLHYALHQEVLILNNFQPSNTDRFGWTRQNMPRLVEVLLDYGADPNARIERAFAYLENLFLSRAGEDPPQIDPVGATPLLVAAASGDIESMRILEEVSDVRATTDGGATVFMLAAGAGAERGARGEKEALAAAKFALSIGGGDVNDHLTERALDGPGKGQEDGRTALHFATDQGWKDMIRFLVEHGAELNAKDRYGMTPLQIALGDPEGRYFRPVGGNYDWRFRLPRAEGKGIKELADLLLALGAEPFTGKYRDRSGE